jgi:aspartyl-tRNA(Asn)/glutamyl-tRNA(Gln) amidotransferase subunit C
MKGKFNIKYISELAKIELEKEEEKRLSKELTKILTFVEKLNEVDTSSLSPLIQLFEQEDIFKNDQVIFSDISEDFLKIVPEKEEGFVKVPKIIEK